MKILGVKIKRDQLVKAMVVIASIALLLTGLVPFFLSF